MSEFATRTCAERAPESPTGLAISSAEELIAEARAGRMVILVDDEDRENEGDLVIPADCADERVIAFMARNACGLICLALSGDRIDSLGLPLMHAFNGTRHETAFTVSIEAREGVSTGISAADRAKTIAVAIASGSRPGDLVSPGHVFPLRARDGGVLVRAGHTEAAVDLSRLAGRPPAGAFRDYGLGIQLVCEAGFETFELLRKSAPSLPAIGGYAVNILPARP